MQISGWEMWWSQPYLQVARRSRPFHHCSYYPSVFYWKCYLEHLVQLTLEKNMPTKEPQPASTKKDSSISKLLQINGEDWPQLDPNQLEFIRLEFTIFLLPSLTVQKSGNDSNLKTRNGAYVSYRLSFSFGVVDLFFFHSNFDPTI